VPDAEDAFGRNTGRMPSAIIMSGEYPNLRLVSIGLFNIDVPHISASPELGLIKAERIFMTYI